MYEILDAAQYPEYNAFVNGHKNGYFTQATPWACVKSNWKHEVVAVRGNGGGIIGGALLLIMPMGAGALMYAPRGPVCNYDDEQVLRNIMAGAAAVAKKYKAHIFKCDPFVDETDAQTIELFKRCGFNITLNADFKSTIQPRYNYMLRYLKNMDEQTLLKKFSSGTRYYINFPQKNGVECRDVGLAGMDDFYKLYAATGTRQAFSVRPRAYLESLLNCFGDSAKLYMCYHEGQPLCGGIALQYGGKTAHVYGCSSNEKRKLNAPHLLQWQLMRWAIAGGCTTYDMQGVAITPQQNEALYGVYNFKQHFAGELVTTAGEFEVIYRPLYSSVMNFALKLRAIFKKS